MALENPKLRTEAIKEQVELLRSLGVPGGKIPEVLIGHVVLPFERHDRVRTSRRRQSVVVGLMLVAVGGLILFEVGYIARHAGQRALASPRPILGSPTPRHAPQALVAPFVQPPPPAIAAPASQPERPQGPAAPPSQSHVPPATVLPLGRPPMRNKAANTHLGSARVLKSESARPRPRADSTDAPGEAGSTPSNHELLPRFLRSLSPADLGGGE
jgi:hypothetical protein